MSENAETNPGSLRVGDRERDDAVRLLDGHFSAGRLTDDEHGERINAAYAARTRHDLDVLFTDLPGGRRAGPDGGGRADTGTAESEPAGGDTQSEQDVCRPAIPRWLPFLLVVAVIGALGAARGWPAGLAPLIIVAAVLLARRGGCCGHRRHH